MKFTKIETMGYNTKLITLLAAHIIFTLLLYHLLVNFNLIQISPNNNNLLNWDASWYLSIKEKGYQFIPNKTSNLAFFPLFPYLWKAFGVNAVAICFFNLILFLSSFFLLFRKENIASNLFLFLLSIPSLIFFFLPYSEATFFLFGVIIIKGYKRDLIWLKVIGFLGASLARSVSLIFVPAIIITELLLFLPSYTLRQRIPAILASILANIAGFLSVAVLQGLQTGKWFYFLEVQKYWKREWTIPTFPFTTYDEQRVLCIDGVSFVVGIFAVIYCIRCVFIAIRKLYSQNMEEQSIAVEPATLFSAIVLSMTLLLDVFFTSNASGHTNIWSLNRHLLCSPFAMLFILNGFKYFSNNYRNTAVLMLTIVVISSYLTGVFQFKYQLFYYFLFLTALGILVVRPKDKLIFLLAYLVNLTIQLFFFQDFLIGKWIA